MLSKQLVGRPAVTSVWVGEEKGCRNSWRKELESNKELYLTRETNHVADMSKKKKSDSRDILIKTSVEDSGFKSYIL